MEEDNYGAYIFYFNLLRNFGTFPYQLDSRGTRLSLCEGGPFVWMYYLNFAVATFHIFFQYFQLFFIFLDGVDNIYIIGQLTWCLLALLPMSNYIKSFGDEGHFAAVVNEWCHLERRIIGSAFRGLAIAKKGPTPTLSTCHFRQKERFDFISRYYIILGIIGAIVVGCHSYGDPKFSAYLYTLSEEGEESEVFHYLSVAFQLWVYAIIWSNIYAIEVLTTVMSSSIGHILETLSYKGGVVMTRWGCDEIPVLDLIHKKHADVSSKAFEALGSAMTTKSRKHSALLTGAEYEQDVFAKTEMSRIIQNLVDIEYGIEGYLRVESLIEAYNHSFARMIPGHQFVYLLMLTLHGFNAIQLFSSMDGRIVLAYTVLMALFILRMLTFFPAMGNVDHKSDAFIDSWMEGLRYIPKGKQSYELYWYRIKSCRLLDFRCGRYFNMERQTCLEFLFRVSEFVIVLMQIYYTPSSTASKAAPTPAPPLMESLPESTTFQPGFM